MILFQCGLDGCEGSLHLGTDAGKYGDEDDRNAPGDQTVLNRGSRGLVPRNRMHCLMTISTLRTALRKLKSHKTLRSEFIEIHLSGAPANSDRQAAHHRAVATARLG
jgi:hypothetical protein